MDIGKNFPLNHFLINRYRIIRKVLKNILTPWIIKESQELIPTREISPVGCYWAAALLVPEFR